VNYLILDENYLPMGDSMRRYLLLIMGENIIGLYLSLHLRIHIQGNIIGLPLIILKYFTSIVGNKKKILEAIL